MGYETDISTVLLQVSCTFCGKPLRVPESLERGYGPDCDQNYMSGAGAAMVEARMERGFDEAEAALALQSAPTIVPTNWVNPLAIAKRGQKIETPDGIVKAKGGEILKSTPLKPGSLREYWTKKGGSADDPRAPWRTNVDVRHAMVSYGIWYASRAVTFGFDGNDSTAQKVDPRFEVVASVQRFARAVGLTAAADRMANFYAARVMKMVKATISSSGKNAIVFESHVPPSHQPFRSPIGRDHVRVHAPYSEQYNRLVRENREVFVAFEKDPPYFWRYFRAEDLRKVINILQECFGDRPALTRKMRTREERLQRERMTRIIDAWTGEVRLFPSHIARRLLTEQPKTRFKTQLRYQEV